MKVILGSGSEWRKKLFALLDEPFEVVVTDADESVVDCDDPEDLVAELAMLKASVLGNKLSGTEDILAITADTVVYCAGKILGKPKSRKDAANMIRLLTRQPHEVWTGVCVANLETGEKRVEAVRTGVRFSSMSEEQMEKYLDTNEWQGKAGGYQIQKAILPFVAEVDGSVSNVIGLPLQELVNILEEMGIAVEKNVKKIEESLLKK